MVKMPRRSSRTVTGSDLSDNGAVGTTVNKNICDSCKKAASVQINVTKNDEGKTLREQFAHDCNRYVSGEVPCKCGLHFYNALKIRYRLKADPQSQLSCADLPFNPPPTAAACKAAGKQHPVGP